jgi:hypothetical protein
MWFDYERGRSSGLRVTLDGVGLEDRAQRFSISGLRGSVSWSRDRPAQSKVRWENGYVYRVPFGAAELQWSSEGRDLKLTDELSLPVLNGALLVHSGKVQNAGGSNTAWRLEGVLTPMSMDEFSHVMGWPRMGGSISAVVPKVNYAGQILSMGGAVLVRVFDGEIVLRNLRLARPSGSRIDRGHRGEAAGPLRSYRGLRVWEHPGARERVRAGLEAGELAAGRLRCLPIHLT